MQKKKLKAWLPLLFSLSMIAGMFLGYRMRDSMPMKSFFYMEQRKPVQEILDLVANKYVDQINVNDLADSAIMTILSRLDPHSQYIPAQKLQDANEDIAGGFYGIGVQFNLFDDTMHVIRVLKDGPSEKAGIRSGDKFLKAGDSSLVNRNTDGEDIRRLLKGNRGSKLPITLLRDSKILVVNIERDIVPVSSVDATYMIDDTTGYIRLNKFSQKTYREFMESLMPLKKQGMTQLVLDLRGNGGGVLDEAVEIADEFLEGDKLITYTEGAHVKRQDYRCRREGQFETGKLVVLTDEGTASASEVLIGALQDWDRATIVGRKTFGKGLVQEQFELSDRSAVRLTVSRYYTPLGRSIQRSYAEGGKAYYEEVAKRFIQSDSIPVDTIIKETGKKYTTRNGKTVFGGGGITPDHQVPHDTSSFGMAMIRIYSGGLVNDFGYKYYIANKGSFSAYKTIDQFNKGFTVNEKAWTYFDQMAAKDSIPTNRLTVNEKAFLTKNLKLSLARQLFNDEGYFEILNKEDAGVRKAMEVLNGKGK